MNPETLKLVNKFAKGKKNLVLTIGCFSDGNTVVRSYNEHGEIENAPSYHYEIGSVTKTFTTSLLAKHLNDRGISLDAHLNQIIKNLPDDKYYPTLKRIATHTSGYSTFLPFNIKLVLDILQGKMKRQNPFTGKMNEEDMVKYILSKKLADKDYSFAYSNFGFAVLGYVLEQLTGYSYWDLMPDYISNELGLKNTHLGTTAENIHGYDNKDRDCGNWQWTKENIFTSAGGISSTAEDLLEYARLNMEESKPYFSLCHQKHSIGKKHDMALTWYLNKEGNILSHEGETGSFSSFLGIEKKKKIAFVVLSNYSCYSINKIGFSLFNR